MGNTRATQVPPKGLKLPRKLFKDQNLGQSFNGVSSLSPEIGMLELKGSGKSSPALLSLRMPKEKRQQLELSVARGLGAGSRVNPLISKSQDESSTDCLAFSFGDMGRALTGDFFS